MSSRFRFPIAALFALALLGAAGCSDDEEPTATPAADGDGGGGAAEVAVDDNLFDPEVVSVGVGDTVTWTWVGEEPHNVVGDDFESEIQTEGTFDHTFEEEGTFDYVCQVHPGMEGSVEVSA